MDNLLVSQTRASVSYFPPRVLSCYNRSACTFCPVCQKKKKHLMLTLLIVGRGR